MNFELTPEQELIKKAAREFTDELVAPRVEQMEATHESPKDLYKAMGEAGFLGVMVPEEYGGSNLGSLAAMLIIEEISRVSSALGTGLQVHILGYVPLVQMGSEELKRKYLPGMVTGDYIATCAVTEASGGSDPTSMSTVAVKQGDEWVINGRKCFITMNDTANACCVVAKTKDEPKKEFTGFFVDKTMDGYRTGRMEHKIGFHGLDNGDLAFVNCRVPESNIIGAQGKGIAVAFGGIGRWGRLGMSSAALGVIKGSLDAAVKFANERILYGKPIAELQAIQFKIAEIFYLLQTSRLVAYKAAWLVDQNTPDAELGPHVACSKLFATQSAIRAANLAVEIMGGYGVVAEYSAERFMRDANMIWAAAGTADIMNIIMARGALAGKE